MTPNPGDHPEEIWTASRGRIAFYADITNDRDIRTTYNRHDHMRQHVERDYQLESGLFGRQTVRGFLRNNLTFDHAHVKVTRFPLGTTRRKRAVRRASRLTLHELIPDSAPTAVTRCTAPRAAPLRSNRLLSVYLLRFARFKVCRQGGINKAISTAFLRSPCSRALCSIVFKL